MSPTIDQAGIFRTFIHDSFESAAKAFSGNPSAENWDLLKRTMWAWQHVHQMDTAQCKLAFATIINQLAIEAKGDTNFGEP